MQFKLDILKWYHDNGSNCHAAAEHFGEDQKMVRNWLGKEKEMQITKSATNKKHLEHGSVGISTDLDAAVLAYLIEERSEGRPVSNKQLEVKALELGPMHNIPPSFKASSMWLKRWNRRNSVCLHFATDDSQKVPEDYWNVLNSIRSSIIKLQIQHSYPKSSIFNMDQTMCRFDMPPNRTNDILGTKSICIVSMKATKKGFTVTLCTNGMGEKLSAFIIFKEKMESSVHMLAGC